MTANMCNDKQKEQSISRTKCTYTNINTYVFTEYFIWPPIIYSFQNIPVAFSVNCLHRIPLVLLHKCCNKSGLLHC